MYNLANLLHEADKNRFKLLALVGKDTIKRDAIIKELQKEDWLVVDVGQESRTIMKMVEEGDRKNKVEILTKINEWYDSQPNKLILTNAGILYDDLFARVTPIGAFKYASRNKNSLLFLEDETKLGSRVYYGDVGTREYVDQDVNGIVLVDIKDIDETSISDTPEEVQIQLTPESIAHFFQFFQIKDVIDIDSDLREQDSRHELVSSYILSPSLEEQIVAFFQDLIKPFHKARIIIGNYGSGKSHLVALLVCLVDDPELAQAIQSEAVRKAVQQLGRKFFQVQFELQSGQVDLKTWFYDKVRKQLLEKYGLEIPVFDPIKDYDDKENIRKIVELIKEQEPTAGLLVVIDEVSDFLSAKQKPEMKADLQFLRVLGQVCQDRDFMFVGSMQEDVFTSPKFMDVASGIGRVGERFQNIIIHKEDVRKVISQRIVPKTSAQRHALEQKLTDFAQKIEPVSVHMDDYVDLFPLTPFLLEMFSDLPYFEKRGVIQFATSEIRQKMFQPFPYFLTFERIYDLLANNPNKKNLEEIFDITKAMGILEQKVQLLDAKYRKDAIRVIKALAVYSLWDRKESGATAEEIANHLMLLPANKRLASSDHVELIVKKVREVTDGQYLKVEKLEDGDTTYFRFEKKAGVDPEEKIRQKAAAVSDDEVEEEIFRQIQELLELERLNGHLDVFHDECSWPSVKSFRLGHVYLVGRNYRIPEVGPQDYALVVISPFVEQFDRKVHERQLEVHIQISTPENVEFIKEVVAIRDLINGNFQPSLMSKKLEQRIQGYRQGAVDVTGLRYRLAKMLINVSRCSYNGLEENIKQRLGRESASVPEIFDSLKTVILDSEFTNYYHAHPVYSSQLSATNITGTCTTVCQDLASGNYTSLGKSTRLFLERLSLLNPQGYPDYHGSHIAQKILEIVKSKGSKVTEIQKDLVEYFAGERYGLEPEIVHVHLIFFVVQGKLFLQARGGEKWDINNIKEKFKSTAQFENLLYVRPCENMSFDFAERLLNTLGLNGAQIHQEKERSAVFAAYKQRVSQIREELVALGNVVETLRNSTRVHLDVAAVSQELARIQEIPWQSLDIENFTKFGTIEHLNNNLPRIEIELRSMTNLTQALAEYNELAHPSLEYMEEALRLMDKHAVLKSDQDKSNRLQQLHDDVAAICRDFDAYKDRSLRNPIKGKVIAFRRTYKYDVYIPAHDKYVGKNIEWSLLDDYHLIPEFIKLKKLFDLKHLSGSSAFHALVSGWLDLKKFACANPRLDQQLESSVFCQDCLFPQLEGYARIPGVLGSIEDELTTLYEQVEKNVVKLVREYRDNVQYLNESEQALIRQILDDKALPKNFPANLIPAISNLLREVEIIEVSRHDFLDRLFPDNQLVSIAELNDGFALLLNSLRQNKDDREVRIKLK